MKLLIISFSCLTGSQGINPNALAPCAVGLMCDGNCLRGANWCYDLKPIYCKDIGVMTNDLELCADDDFWKDVSCNLIWKSQVIPGERCTDCDDRTRNFCFYPKGLPGYGYYSTLPTTCDCDSSQDKNYDAVVPCQVPGSQNDGMKCGGECLDAAYWCNDKYRKRCSDSGVMTNDPDLCSQDERWSGLSCDFYSKKTWTQYPGERCSGCNYCFYPQGPLEDLEFLPTTCEPCVSTASTTVILVVIIIIVMIAAVAGGFYYYKKKQQGPSHDVPAKATQESEMGKM